MLSQGVNGCPASLVSVALDVASCWKGIFECGLACMQVLGGYVEHLVEGWEFQRRFGGNKAEPMASEDQARAPKFTHYIPGKTRHPSKYVIPTAGQRPDTLACWHNMVSKTKHHLNMTTKALHEIPECLYPIEKFD